MSTDYLNTTYSVFGLFFFSSKLLTPTPDYLHASPKSTSPIFSPPTANWLSRRLECHKDAWVLRCARGSSETITHQHKASRGDTIFFSLASGYASIVQNHCFSLFCHWEHGVKTAGRCETETSVPDSLTLTAHVGRMERVMREKNKGLCQTGTRLNATSEIRWSSDIQLEMQLLKNGKKTKKKQLWQMAACL